MPDNFDIHISGFPGPSNPALAAAVASAEASAAEAATSEANVDEAVSAVEDLRAGITISSPDDAWRLKDAQGRVKVKIDAEGIHEKQYDRIKQIGGVISLNNPTVFLVTDPSGYVVFKAGLGGVRFPGYVEMKALVDGAPALQSQVAAIQETAEKLSVGVGLSATQRAYQLIASLAHFMTYGQSLSMGTQGQPALSTTPLAGGWAKMFAVIRSRDAEQDYSSLNPLAESNDDANTHGETGLYAAAEMIEKLLLDEDGIDISLTGQKALFSAPGEGSQSVLQLSEGSDWFTRLALDMSSGKARAAEADLTYFPQGVGWIHGEEDYDINTPPEDYILRARALFDQIRAKALEITGIDRPVPFILTQLASHRFYGLDPTIAEALLALTEYEDVALATPLYPFTHFTDHKHLINTSYQAMGGYLGIALKRWLWDGVKPRHLKPLQPTWFDNAVVIPYDPPSGRIVFDTSIVTDPGNYGYGLLDPDGGDLAIAGVSIAGTRVAVNYASEPPDGSRVTCGWGTLSDTNTGPTGGARACLRDTQGDTIVQHGWAFHNHVPIHSFTKG